jgi:hypothetical protein
MAPMVTQTPVIQTSQQAAELMQQMANNPALAEAVAAGPATSGTTEARSIEAQPPVNEEKARAVARSAGRGWTSGARFGTQAPTAPFAPNYGAMAKFLDSLPAEIRFEVLGDITKQASKGGK